MKNSINILLFVVAALLCSCSSEPLNEQTPLGKDDVQIQLSLTGSDTPQNRATNAGTSMENYIHSVQLFFFENIATTPVKVLYLTSEHPLIDNNVTWNYHNNTITMRKVLSTTTPYTVYAVINKEIKTNITQATDLDDAIIETSQPIAAPTQSQGLVMSGKQSSYKFGDNNNKMAIDVTRHVAKVQLTIKLDPALATKYPSTVFNKNLITVRTLNVPTKYYLFSHSTLPNGTSIVDINPINTTIQGNDRRFQAYLCDNPITGATEESKKNGTQFIISLPYTSGGKRIDNNFYMVTASTDANNPYNITRNNLYDMTVTIKDIGSEIPSFYGTEVSAKVLPWTGVDFDITTDNTNVIGLSNTTCKIVGDYADDILVGMATLLHDELEGEANVSIVGNDCSLASPSSIILRNGTMEQIRINTQPNFTSCKVQIKLMKEVKEISVTKENDNAILFFNANKVHSDATWCSLSQEQEFIYANQKQMIDNPKPIEIIAHISKTTLGNDVRKANIISTINGTPNIEERVIVVQQPFLKESESSKLVWASGNICLGYRPDGTKCFVIGDSKNSGLWFFANKIWGMPFKSSGFWDPSIPGASGGTYYIPAGTGKEVTVSTGNNNNYENTYNNAPVGDPCEYVYTSDNSIKWRTPTKDELQILVDTKGSLSTDATGGWSGGINSGDGNGRSTIAFHTLRGKLYLKFTGFRNSGGQVDKTNSSITTIVGLWSNTSFSQWDNSFYIAETSVWNQNGWTGISNIAKSAALAIRCVRTIK